MAALGLLNQVPLCLLMLGPPLQPQGLHPLLCPHLSVTGGAGMILGSGRLALGGVPTLEGPPAQPRLAFSPGKEQAAGVWETCLAPHEVRRGAHGASRVAPGKSGVYACDEEEPINALESW